MIVTIGNGSGTERATAENVRTLMACDIVRTFEEAGWLCAIGYKQDPSGPGMDLVVALHFSSLDEYLGMTGQGRDYGSADTDYPLPGPR